MAGECAAREHRGQERVGRPPAVGIPHGVGHRLRLWRGKSDDSSQTLMDLPLFRETHRHDCADGDAYAHPALQPLAHLQPRLSHHPEASGTCAQEPVAAMGCGGHRRRAGGGRCVGIEGARPAFQPRGAGFVSPWRGVLGQCAALVGTQWGERPAPKRALHAAALQPVGHRYPCGEKPVAPTTACASPA